MLAEDYVVDYAFIIELLYGGYTYQGTDVRQCSKKIQELFFNNDIVGIIEYRDYLLNNGLIAQHWINAINKSSAIRYFILCSFHDAKIMSLTYNENKRHLEMELSLFNCCHGLALSEKDDKNQKVVILFNGIDNCKEILNKLIFDKISDYSFIQQRLEVKDRINLKIQLRTYGNTSCCECWIDLLCDEIFIVEKH